MPQKTTTRKTPPPRDGYVLIMTVMIMALVSLLLVAIANQSLGLATEAVLQETSLQMRWKSISCQNAILKESRSILKHDEREQRLESLNQNSDAISKISLERLKQTGLRRIGFTVWFNGKPNRLVISDENSKLNLIKAQRLKSRQHVQKLVRKLSGQTPLRATFFEESVWESWGQLIDLSKADRNRQSQHRVESATRAITLWGNGKLNAQTCSDEVLTMALELVLLRNPAREVVETRTEFPHLDFSAVLEKTDIDEDLKNRLTPWVVNESKTFSLWIEELETSGREFHVVSLGNGIPQFHSFLW